MHDDVASVLANVEPNLDRNTNSSLTPTLITFHNEQTTTSIAQTELHTCSEARLKPNRIPRTASTTTSTLSQANPQHATMDFILGLGIALPVTAGVAIGAVTGVAQGVSHQQKANEEAKNANPESRMVKFHIDTRVDDSLRQSPGYALMSSATVVLRDDKLWIERRDAETGAPARKDSHPFTGFYVQYPDNERVPPVRGLVSTITADPPMLNWVYVDKETYEVKYSNRSGSIAHIVGEWDWTDEFEDSCLNFDGWEPFVAVEEPGFPDEAGNPRWALYVDYEDDGLEKRKSDGETLECILERRIITDQEFNKWGIGQQGNIGFKSTKEIDKISKKKEEDDDGAADGGVKVEPKQ